jgi:hypothetical protein
MQLGQIATGFAEGPKIRGLFYAGNARQLFAEIVGIAFAVVGGIAAKRRLNIACGFIPRDRD